MAHRLTIPGTTYIGKNALADALADISALGKHALVVSGNSMKKAGHLEMLTARLQESGVSSTVFSGITGEPTDIMVENGTALYRECGADFIIGFGGGSQLDAAKAIGILASNPGSISDCCCKPIPASLPPLVAI
ncbi:MAG: iron-containing alcohol dehydrogenase, partial [Clostridia bacterium]